MAGESFEVALLRRVDDGQREIVLRCETGAIIEELEEAVCAKLAASPRFQKRTLAAGGRSGPDPERLLEVRTAVRAAMLRIVNRVQKESKGVI